MGDIIKLMRNAHAPHIDFNEFQGLIKSNPRALPSDIDMMLERKCKFLVGEWKRNGESISKGQLILLQNLAKLPQFVVLIIHGNTDSDTVVNKFEWITKRGMFKLGGSSLEDLKDFIVRWYAHADK
jgi:hypothetical protein